MLPVGTRDEAVRGPSIFEAAPLNIHDSSFASIAAEHQLDLRSVFPETSGQRTAGDELDSRWQGSGKRIRDIYLNDPELQRIYPLGLVPFGQKHFLGWLTTHGRKDQQLIDEEILSFLAESAKKEVEGLGLTYLIQPSWQEYFPLALTRGWEAFRRWIEATYGQLLRAPLPDNVPPSLSVLAQPAKHREDPDGARLQGVNLLGHFCSPSGIQQAALWAKAALERAGLITSCRDVPVPRRVTPSNRAQWLGTEVFSTTIMSQAGHPFFVSGHQRSGLYRRPGVYRIAYWNWELETIPDEWMEAAKIVDEIWSPTEFVAESMRARMPRPVYKMLPGVEIGPIEAVPRTHLNIPEDHFVFLFMFDLHSQIHRKNPVGVFHAFREAFRRGDKTTLIIKTSGEDIHSRDLAEITETIRGSNVVLINQLFSRGRAYGLIAMADCFVSLHRSEGFGLGLAEAMLLGKPVIATGYSGNLDFMTRENSLLVDYERVEITEDRPIYTRGNFWAEPSVAHAAALMRDVYEHPEEARSRARRVQPEIQEQLSLETAGQRMRSRLEQIAAT
jgi:glycosyltransferase involved in cell wall biosynthesis